MKTVCLALVFLITNSLGLLTGSAQKRQTTNSPDAVVKELYRVHRNGYGHIFEKSGKKNQQKFFDRNLAGLIWKDLTETPVDEVGHLDFDPLFNAQDTKITRFRVGAPVVDGEKVTVTVSFNNFDRRESLKFLLVKESGVWKIANIDYGEGTDLVKLLNEPI